MDRSKCSIAIIALMILALIKMPVAASDAPSEQLWQAAGVPVLTPNSRLEQQPVREQDRVVQAMDIAKWSNQDAQDLMRNGTQEILDFRDVVGVWDTVGYAPSKHAESVIGTGVAWQVDAVKNNPTIQESLISRGLLETLTLTEGVVPPSNAMERLGTLEDKNDCGALKDKSHCPALVVLDKKVNADAEAKFVIGDGLKFLTFSFRRHMQLVLDGRGGRIRDEALTFYCRKMGQERLLCQVAHGEASEESYTDYWALARVH